MERSLREAGSELQARIAAGRERRFPIMGLKGAANALMVREAAIGLERPLIVITPLASEAEALAGELAFFMDQPGGTGSRRCAYLSVACLGDAAVRPSFAAAGRASGATCRALRAAAQARADRDPAGRGADDADDAAARVRGLGNQDRAGRTARSGSDDRGAGGDGLSAACRRPRNPAISACAAGLSTSSRRSITIRFASNWKMTWSPRFAISIRRASVRWAKSRKPP